MLTFLILFAYLSGEHLRKSEQQSLNQLRQLVEMAYNTIHPKLVIITGCGFLKRKPSRRSGRSSAT